MSGGLWDYQNNRLRDEIFGYIYEQEGEKVKIPNALEDKILSEMVWDMLNMLGDFDYYKCGDTCKDTWLKSKQKFKDKWLGKDNATLYKGIIDKSLEELREDLYDAIGISNEE